MSLSDPSSSVVPSPGQHFGDSYWSQFPMNNDQFGLSSQYERSSQFDPQQPPLKRLQSFDENPSNHLPNSRPNLPINKGTARIFFKTRMCAKFKAGICRNGESCNFAHGMEDMRQPPPNWQELAGIREDDRRSSDNWDDDRKIIHKMKLCIKFNNGEECPYGDRCNFLHEDPSKYRDDSGRFREITAICIGTAMGHSNGSHLSEVGRCVSSEVDSGMNMKPVYWKTKLCTKFEIMGQCPFGDNCHFAHGFAELQAPVVRVEGEAANTAPIEWKPQQMLSSEVLPTGTSTGPLVGEGQMKKSLLKWKADKKINQIYADWLDDSSLPNSPSNTET